MSYIAERKSNEMEAPGMNPLREQSVNNDEANGPRTSSTVNQALAEQTEDVSQSQQMVVEDVVIQRANSDAKINQNDDKDTEASKDTEKKKESTSFERIRRALKSSEKSKSSMHGNLYHVHVALISCLRLFKRSRQDDFIISVEVGDAGKFDDIMVHTHSGTWFLQLKHKMGQWNITEKGLFEASGDLSIPTYFESYLEVDKVLQKKYHTCPWYALCTNGSDKAIKDPKKGLSKNYKERDAAMEEVFKDINGTCYQFDPDILIEKMYDPCIDKLADIIAKKVTNDRSKTDIINFDNGLVNIFASLIKEFLQSLEAEPSDPSVLIYSIMEKDGNADVSTPIGMFQSAFIKKIEMAKNKQNKDSNYGTPQLKIKIDKESFNAAASTEWREKFKEKLGEFCERFVLVANTSDEETIREEASTKFTMKNDIILSMLIETLLNALKRPDCIDGTVLKKIFRKLEVIEPLMSKSREYLDSLKRKYPHIELKSERLKQSSLNAFIINNESIHEFSCSLDLDVSTLIIDQTLSLHQYETLVLNSAENQVKREMLDMLEDLLSYLRGVDHPTIKVVTILGQLELEHVSKIRKLCEQYSRKVVVVGTMTGSAESEKFFVRDLTPGAKVELFLKHEQQIILETVTPLESIIHEDDDLGLLLSVLKLCHRSMQLERYDSITKCFQNIEPWYINREFLPLDSRLDESDDLERVYLLFLFNEETYRISEIEKHLTSLERDDIVKLKNTLKPFNEKPQHPPGLGKDENDKKVCIFLNEAGAGKTTYFTWLAWHLSTNDQSLYVIKLIALEYSTDFERLKESGIENWSDDQMVRFLYRLIHLALFVQSVCRRTIEETDEHRAEADRCAEALSLLNGQIALDNSKTKQLTTKQVIELRLFREKFNRKQLILILDGYDEIAPYYKDVVMKCFARFSYFEGIRNLYLSSRPYDLEEELKKSFPNCQMYRLKKFSTSDVGTFLHKRLAVNMDDYKDCNENQQSSFLFVLYDILIEILDRSATVPLLLDMAFITLLPAIKEHVNFKTDTMSPKSLRSSKLDLFQLIEQFVARKMQILHTDKSGTTNAAASTPAAKKREKEENKRIKELHMLLAMCTLFDSDDRAKLLSEQEEARVVQLLKEVEEAEEKTGIISGVQDGRPQFVHRLFAEYFVACWLHQNWKRFKQEAVFRSKVIWGESMKKVREFFDRIIVRESEGCELHQAVLDGNYDLIKEIIRNNPFAVTVKDKVGRSPLHVDVCFGIGMIVEEYDLLEELPLDNINHRDDLYGWNALDYAFVLQNGVTVQDLLKHKAELNVEILMQQLSSNDTDNLIWQGCNNVEFLHNSEQLEIANEISARVVEQLINERKVNIYAPRNNRKGWSLLEYCASRKDGCMFVQLVTQIGTPLVQVLQDGLGKRLLEIAFNTKAYSVLKFLIEECNISLPSIIDIQDLCAVVRHTIEENDFLWFEKLFQQLCRQMNVICTNVMEEEVHESLGVDFETDFKGQCCCYKSFKEHPFLSNDRYGKIDEKYIMEYLLTQAVNTGHVKIVSYIHQKTKMTVTNKLIKMIMVFLPKQWPGTDHKQCIPAFQYLLNKTIDLWSVDDDGRNLFHFVAQEGCAYMLPCLIAKGFDPTEINPQNKWNGLDYLVSSEDFFWRKRVLKVFKWLLPYFDDYLKDFTAFERVFDCQIKQYWNRIQIVFPILLERMLSKQETESVREALLAARETQRIDGRCPDTAWFAIYDDFIKRIPIL